MALRCAGARYFIQNDWHRGRMQGMDDATAFAERTRARLDRLDLSPQDAARAAGLPADFLDRLFDGQPPPRGQRLVKLANVLTTSVAYLVGLDPDDVVPAEYLEEDQGQLGLLAGDEEILLRAYRRLDFSAKAALLQVVLRMAPEPQVDERKPRQVAPRAGT